MYNFFYYCMYVVSKTSNNSVKSFSRFNFTFNHDIILRFFLKLKTVILFILFIIYDIYFSKNY